MASDPLGVKSELGSPSMAGCISLLGGLGALGSSWRRPDVDAICLEVVCHNRHGLRKTAVLRMLDNHESVNNGLAGRTKKGAFSDNPKPGH